MRRTNGKSGVLGGFCIALVLILLVGGFGYVTQGFKNWDAKTWFRSTEEQETPSETTEPIETGGTQAVSAGFRMSADTDTGVMPVLSFQWVVDSEGDFELNFTCATNNEVVTKTVHWVYEKQKRDLQGTSYNVRTTISADMADLIAQGYTNFTVTPKLSNEVTPSVSGSVYSWLFPGQTSPSEGIYDVYSFTCETSWTMVPLPADPVKEGYTFTGWYTDEACTQLYTGSTVRDDMTLYAGFRINEYTITFDEAGGGSVGDVTSDYNTTPTLPTPTREGYNFLGWFTADGQAYDATAPLKSNKALVAHWEIKKFKVTFMVDGAVYQEMTVDYGAALVPAAKELLLNVLAVEGAAGSVAVGEDGEISVLNDVVVMAVPMQGVEKAAAWGVQNSVALVGGVVLLALIVGIAGALTSRKKKQH